MFAKALSTLAVALSLATVPAVNAATHIIVVGQGGALTFTPSNITADVGDVLTFQFVQKNHSATQTSFDAPCTPAQGGFNSGFEPVASGQTTNFPEFSLTVNDTNPIWVSCQQINHCPGFGMTFAANTPPDQTYAQFKANALAT